MNQPEIVSLLSQHFVPIALDNVENPNLTADERKFLKGKGLEFCTQGMSVFTADGTVLAMGGGYNPVAVQRMLDDALVKFCALPPAQPRSATAAEQAGRTRPPQGGLVLFVTWKVLEAGAVQSSATTGNGQHDPQFRDAVGVDRLWVRPDEAAELARGQLPESLRRRMARYHLSYVMAGKVPTFEGEFRDGHFEGSFDSDSGERGQLVGQITTAGGRVTGFELLARGLGSRVADCGFSAGLTVVPDGARVPVAVLFALADPQDELARVLPHRCKDQDYLR